MMTMNADNTGLLDQARDALKLFVNALEAHTAARRRLDEAAAAVGSDPAEDRLGDATRALQVVQDEAEGALAAAVAAAAGATAGPPEAFVDRPAVYGVRVDGRIVLVSNHRDDDPSAPDTVFLIHESNIVNLD